MTGRRNRNRAPAVRQQFGEAVRQVLATLTDGTVLTYGDVAREAGYDGAARAVGNFLSHSSEQLPWWRVVTSTGRLVPGHEVEQARLLHLEGVVLANGRVVIARALVARGSHASGERKSRK